jgi:hypothetical protein
VTKCLESGVSASVCMTECSESVVSVRVSACVDEKSMSE